MSGHSDRNKESRSSSNNLGNSKVISDSNLPTSQLECQEIFDLAQSLATAPAAPVLMLSHPRGVDFREVWIKGNWILS